MSKPSGTEGSPVVADGAAGGVVEGWQREAVARLIADMSDRRGFRGVLESLDADVRAELTETWVRIVGNTAARPLAPRGE